ncbi:hypothetical protein R0K18_36150, partial [Pantoea sp. SIMBA_133]
RLLQPSSVAAQKGGSGGTVGANHKRFTTSNQQLHGAPVIREFVTGQEDDVRGVNERLMV